MNARRLLLTALALGLVVAVAYVLGAFDRSSTDPTGDGAAGRSEPTPGEAAALRGQPPATPEDAGPPPPRGVVEGRVLDEHGQPVVDVAVRARRAWEPYRRVLLDLPDPATGGPAPAFEVSTTSDADGRFRLEGLRAGLGTWVEALPVAPRSSASVIAEPRPDHPVYVVLHLQRGEALAGRVVDVEGRGVPAWIDAMLPFRNAHRAAGNGTWSVRGLATDAEGRFELPVAPEGEVWLSAYAPTVGERSWVPVEVPATEAVVLRLGAVPGVTLEGRVRDEDGAPVAGAALSVRVAGRLVGLGHQEMGARVGRSGADGTYRIEHVFPGRIQDLRVRAPGYREAAYLGHGILLEEGEVVPFDVVLLRETAIEGRVLDPDGIPAVEVEVQAGSDPQGAVPGTRPAFYRTRTGADGRYRLSLAAAGSTGVRAIQPHGGATEPVRVEAEAGAVVQVPDLRLTAAAPAPPTGPGGGNEAPPTGGIEGRVVAPGGAPVPGLEVEAHGPGIKTVFLAGTQGVFHLDDAAVGTWRLLPRTSGRHVIGDEVVVEVRAGEVTPDVVVETFAPRFLRGVVVDEQGEPVAGLGLGARPSDASRVPPDFGTTSGPDGTFEVTVYEDRDWVLVAGRHAFPGAHATGSRGIRLVHREAEHRRIVLVVRGPDGQPLLDAAVHVTWGDGRFGLACQRAGGRYYAEVPADVRRVDVRVEGAVDPRGRPLDVAPLQVRAQSVEDEPIVIRLERGRSLRVGVTDPDGRPAAGATVRVGPPGAWTAFDAPEAWPTDAQGIATVVGLEPEGELFVVVTSSRHVAPLPVRCPPGAEHVEVRLLGGTSVEGRVEDASGRPVAGARVTAALAPASRASWRPKGVPPRLRPDPTWRVTTDEEGRFRLDRVPEGATVSVQVDGADDAMPASNPSVAAGAVGVVLRRGAGVRVRGHLDGVAGWLALGAVHVSLYEPTAAGSDLGTLVERARPGADGDVDLGPLPAGRYRLLVSCRAVTLVDRLVDAPADALAIPLPTPHPLEVRVADAQGFQVTVVSEDGSFTSTTLDASGTALLLLLDDGPRRVLVGRAGEARVGLVDEVRPSAGPVTIELAPGLAIAGRITGAPPEKVTGFVVRVTGEGLHRSTSPEADGSFRVVGLVPGAYRVHVLPLGAAGSSLRRDDVPAGREDLVLEFEAR